MDKNLLETIEALLRSGQYADAEKQLNEVIRNAPEDWQAQMLFGTCRLFQGDMEGAEKIHRMLEQHYAEVSNIAPAEKTFWEKYHRWIIYGGAIAGGLFVFTVPVAYIFKTQIKAKILDIMVSSVANTNHKYAGPPVNYYCKVCGECTSIGWGWIEDEKKLKNLKSKVSKGLIPCKKCGKDTPFLTENEKFGLSELHEKMKNLGN